MLGKDQCEEVIEETIVRHCVLKKGHKGDHQLGNEKEE